VGIATGEANFVGGEVVPVARERGRLSRERVSFRSLEYHRIEPDDSIRGKKKEED